MSSCLPSRCPEPSRQNTQTGMKMRIDCARRLAVGVILAGATVALAQHAATGAAPARPQGPCDIYAAAGDACAAAHSTTRALYAGYHGPLYQVMRQSDGKKLDIGVVEPTAGPAPDAGGYADAAAQDNGLARVGARDGLE